MACEHALLIEPIAQVVYTNKRPYCNLFSLLVVALCVISFIGFVTYIKTFVYELKTEIANLKDDNQRLANKVEAMNISELQTEIAKLNKEVAKLKEEDLYLWNEAWRHSVVGVMRAEEAARAVPVQGGDRISAVLNMIEREREMEVLDMRSSEVAEAWRRSVGNRAWWYVGGAAAKTGLDMQKVRAAEKVAKAQEALRQDTPNQYRDRKVKALRQDINALYV